MEAPRDLWRPWMIVIDEVTAAKDKMTRAQSIQGRMSMGRVRFPLFAPWWGEAEEELLKFPTARHDDFVDALAHLGNGLHRQIGKSPVVAKKQPRSGTWGWIKQAGKAERDRQNARKITAGW